MVLRSSFLPIRAGFKPNEDIRKLRERKIVFMKPSAVVGRSPVFISGSESSEDENAREGYVVYAICADMPLYSYKLLYVPAENVFKFILPVYLGTGGSMISDNIAGRQLLLNQLKTSESYTGSVEKTFIFSHLATTTTGKSSVSVTVPMFPITVQ